MSGDKIELPADLRAKIEQRVNETLSGDSLLGEVEFLLESIAYPAATLAVEHERELVCEYCGSHNAPPNAVCVPGANYCIDNTKITRAQYEATRGGPTESGYQWRCNEHSGWKRTKR